MSNQNAKKAGAWIKEKSSLSLKKYRTFSDYSFFEKSSFIPTFFREISKKIFLRLLCFPFYQLWRTLPGNGFLAELT